MLKKWSNFGDWEPATVSFENGVQLSPLNLLLDLCKRHIYNLPSPYLYNDFKTYTALMLCTSKEERFCDLCMLHKRD